MKYMHASSMSGVLKSNSAGVSTSQQSEHPVDKIRLLGKPFISVFPQTASLKVFTWAGKMIPPQRSPS